MKARLANLRFAEPGMAIVSPKTNLLGAPAYLLYHLAVSAG
jgi:hypothetical protein